MTSGQSDDSPQTWIEVEPLEPAERAASFITFLLRFLPNTEVQFGPRAGGRYRFHLAAPAARFIQALLESVQFVPIALRSSTDGELYVTLPTSGGVSPAADPASGISTEAEALPPLVGALDRLDGAIGELLDQSMEAKIERLIQCLDLEAQPEPIAAVEEDEPWQAEQAADGVDEEPPEAAEASPATESEAADQPETAPPPAGEDEPVAAAEASPPVVAAGDGRYRILLGDSCPVCKAMSRISFPAERPPQLPIAGCRAEDGCRCTLPDLPAVGSEAQEAMITADLWRAAGDVAADRDEEAVHVQIQLVAHPFANFGRLNQFITMVGGLAGVRSVTLRRFRNGILRLAVDYAGTEPLSAHLRAAKDIPLEILSDGGDLIELAVSDDGRGKPPSPEVMSVGARGTQNRRPPDA